MPEFIPQNCDLSTDVQPVYTGFQIREYVKASLGRKVTLNGKCEFLISDKSYQQMQKVPRNAYNIVLFTYNRYSLPASTGCELCSPAEHDFTECEVMQRCV